MSSTSHLLFVKKQFILLRFLFDSVIFYVIFRFLCEFA